MIKVCTSKQMSALFVGMLLVSNTSASDLPTYNYYAVYGSTVEQLRASFDHNGPMHTESKKGHAHAITQWSMQWGLDYKPHAGKCMVSDVWTKVTTVSILPQWKKPDAVSPQLESKWTAYENALKLHEQGHHQLTMNTAEAFKKALTGTVVAPPCKGVKLKLKQKAAQIYSEFESKQKEYDKQTKYGKTQGVKF